MTPINEVFMLSIDSKLDYETLRKICATGHSRVPVYERVEVPASGVIEARNKAGSTVAVLPSPDEKEEGRTMMVKRIVGIFLVKQVGNLAAPSIRRVYINRNYDDTVCSARSQRYVFLSQSAFQKHRTKRFISSHRCDSPSPDEPQQSALRPER